MESRHFRVHHHDARRDARAAQFHALVRHGHGQVVHPAVLQRLGDFHRPRAVGRSLHHARDFRGGLEERAVEVEVLRDGVEVHVERRFVYALREHRRDLFEAKLACSLHEHHFPLEPFHQSALQECFRRGEETFLHIEERVGRRDFRSHADEALHAAARHHLRHLPVEFIGGQSRLEEVREDERFLFPLHFRAAVHEVQGNVERGHVGVVRVVDDRAVAHPLNHLEAHGHRLQALHAPCDFPGRQLEIEADGEAVDAVADRRLVGEGDFEGPFLLLIIYIGDARGSLQLLDGGNEERALRVHFRPRQHLRLVARPGEAVRGERVVGTADHHLRVLEEAQLFVAFFLHGRKVLLVGRADVRHHADGRLYDGTERLHLVGLGDARLEDAHLRVLRELPHAERHPHLRIVGARRAGHAEAR